MKNRRTAIIAFLLCACLAIGAGYAALTDNLFIKGEATLATTEAQKLFDEDVYFTQAIVEDGTGGTSGSADTIAVGQTDNDSVTFNIKSLALKDESVSFLITIHNAGTCGYDAEIAIDDGQPTNTNTKFFKIEYTTPNGTTVLQGGDLVVKVTVTLLDNPAENTTAGFTVNLTATSVAAAG